ncbi:MAG: hypothetical protein R3F17_08485 [Planctomycetota bacterium]
MRGIRDARPEGRGDFPYSRNPMKSKVMVALVATGLVASAFAWSRGNKVLLEKFALRGGGEWQDVDANAIGDKVDGVLGDAQNDMDREIQGVTFHVLGDARSEAEPDKQPPQSKGAITVWRKETSTMLDYEPQTTARGDGFEVWVPFTKEFGILGPGEKLAFALGIADAGT